MIARATTLVRALCCAPALADDSSGDAKRDAAMRFERGGKRLFRNNDAVHALRRHLDEGGGEVPADRARSSRPSSPRFAPSSPR